MIQGIKISLVLLGTFTFMPGYGQRVMSSTSVPPSRAELSLSTTLIDLRIYNLSGLRKEGDYQPFFCYYEAKLNRKSKFPVYFRLGSKDYVDYLEQKSKLPAEQLR